MKLNDLREQRALKVTEMRALLAKAEAEKRQLSADESTAFDKLKGFLPECFVRESLGIGHRGA